MRRALLLAAIAVGGCAGPARPKPAAAGPPHERQSAPPHERQSAPAPPQRSARPAADPIIAIRAFATAYVNWTPATITTDLQLLAAISIGQARAAMQLASAGAAHDYELQRGGIANRGTVEAIAPLAGTPDQYVVVTLEQTTAANSAAYQGLRPAWHVTIATVASAGPGRWTISGWQPES